MKLFLILILLSTSLFAQKNCADFQKNYIPVDLNDAINYLDCLWSGTNKENFRNKPENEAVSEIHLITGMGIRNSWGLWQEDSDISKYFRDLGINFPDEMSWIILTSFHRYLNKSDIKLEEQINLYKVSLEKSKAEEIGRKRIKINELNLNDTVFFLYNYNFVSKEQENKYMNDSCIAKGLVISKDSIDLRLQIHLLESCDENGIIISKGDTYGNEGNKRVLEQKDLIEIMRPGEIKWTGFDLWQTRKELSESYKFDMFD